MQSRTLIKIMSIMVIFAIVFQFGVVAVEPGLDQDQLTEQIEFYGEGEIVDRTSLKNASYNNIFKFAITRPGHSSTFNFNYSLSEDNKGRFGIEGTYRNYGYKWSDTYEVSVYDIDTGSNKFSASLYKGQDVFFTAPRFINELNRVGSQAGSILVFKSSRARNIIINNELIKDTSKEVTVGYTDLYEHKYRTVMDFKVNNKNFPVPPIDFGYPLAAGIDQDGKIEFYVPNIYSDDYTFADSYEVTKIDTHGLKISSTKLGKGENVRTGLKELVENMQLSRYARPIEVMLQSRENDDSIRVDGAPINSRVGYYTFTEYELTPKTFLNNIKLNISNNVASTNFEYFVTQGDLDHTRFGIYGNFTDQNLNWSDTYEIIVESEEYLKAYVKLSQGVPVMDQPYLLPSSLNDESVTVGDKIKIKTTKPDMVTVNGKLVRTTSSIYKVTEKGLVAIELPQNIQQ